MKKLFFIRLAGVFLILLGGQYTFAQQQKPKWTEGYFEDLNNSYIEVVSATGFDITDAKNKAINTVIANRGLATNPDVSVSITNNENIVVKANKDLIMKSRIITDYSEKITDGVYKTYLLVQTAKHPDKDYDPCSYTDIYPFTPAVFIPGLAQIKKGNTGKGIAFISGEILFVGGALFAEEMRKTNENNISSTHDANLVKQYTDNANTWATVRNLSIAGASIVYIWNVIDGIATKGEKHILLGDAKINISPYTDFQSTGFALNYKF